MQKDINLASTESNDFKKKGQLIEINQWRWEIGETHGGLSENKAQIIDLNEWRRKIGNVHGEEVEQPLKKKMEYKDTDELRKILESLRYKKFMLDCGHKVTFGYFLGNNITIYNGKELKIICSLCGY